MKVLANIITNLFELAGALFFLVLVTGVLLSIDIMGPTLEWITGNMPIVLGIGITYILYKSESTV